jgi:predicted transcriptional regulator
MDSTNSTPHLTAEESLRIDTFLSVFASIESALQKRLQANSTTKFHRLVSDYRQRNPFWKNDADDLDHYAQIRNFLTHERTAEFGYPVAVTQRSVECLKAIKQRLETPRLVGDRYCRRVEVVTPDRSLVDVLLLAFENAFSQFPVVEGERFKGVITENEITRWLGHQVKGGKTKIALSGVTVRQVMTEREEGRPVVFDFRSVNDPEPDVMGMFQRRAGLEVVLLTASGGQDTPIQGIITQWDAARYPTPS